MKLSLRFSPMLLAAVTSLVLTGSLAYKLVRERSLAIEVANSQTQNFARVLEEHARQSLHRVGSNLTQADAALAQLRKAGVQDPLLLRQQLTTLLPADRLIQSFLVLDRTGSVVLSTQNENTAAAGTHAGRDYFTPHVGGADRELVFGAPEKIGAGAQWVLPVSHRISGPGGEFNGALVAMVQPAYFQSFYDSIDRGEDGFVTLFLSSGSAAVTSPHDEAVIAGHWAQSPLFLEHLPLWPTGTVRQVVIKDNIERIYSYRALNDYPVVVTYGLSLSAILAGWQNSVWQDSLLLLIGILLLFGATARLAWHDQRRRAADNERKEIDADLRIAAIAFESQEGILVTDANKVILRVNSAFCVMTGYSAEEAVGKTPRLLFSGRQNDSFYASMWLSINTTGTWQGELWNRRKNGQEYPQHLSITAVKDENGTLTHYVATMIDITLRKAAEDEIEQLAFYDPLTLLPNRRLLLDRLHQALAASARHGRHGALLFLDLDHFKTLNDTLGHDKGDDLLRQVAQRLNPIVREGDTVARLGGDEFVVLLEALSEQARDAADQTQTICAKMLAALNQPYQLGLNQNHTTASIGAVLFIGQQQSFDDLLKQADLALYAAKTAGRNTIRFFDPKMQASITERAVLEADLRLALAEQQFQLYFQKQVTHDGKTVGAEVLIRWHHPQRGLVMPGHFIAQAEETGQIVPIGQWVLAAACSQLKAWEANPQCEALRLAVNVSARQFRQPDFVKQVRQLLLRTGARADRLKLELTESTVLDNVDNTIAKMKALKSLGVRLSIDDFGTGQSSLSYLTQLPLDQLKIDQSFVRNIDIRPVDALIAQTIIGMANNLGMEVIAEGVETETQRLFLEQHGCLLCQGYLFGRPVPLEEFERSLS